MSTQIKLSILFLFSTAISANMDLTKKVLEKDKRNESVDFTVSVVENNLKYCVKGISQQGSV